MTPGQRARRVAQLRRWHARAIDESPAPIEFDRVLLVDDGDGGGEPVTEHVGPLVVRVYQDRYARETVQQPQGNTTNVGQRWGLLAPWDAALRGDPKGESGDAFDHPNGRFRVREVFVKRLGPRPEDVWGVEADIVSVA